MQDPKNFILGGKAIFTIKIKEEHAAAAQTKLFYTFKVEKFGNENNPSYAIRVLTGPDNWSNYAYMGILNATYGKIYLTAKSKFEENSIPVRIARWALSLIWIREQLPDGYEFHHEGRCGRCGRKLTTPESVTSGFGPVCGPLALTAGF